MLCTSFTNSFSAFNEWETSQKVVTMIGFFSLLGAGNYADNLNKEYIKKRKKPDPYMAAIKVATAATTLIGFDILVLGETGSTGENLIKLGAFGASLFAGSDTVANILSHIPCVSGILTGPINENGEEVKETGAAARVLLTYVPLRKFALDFFGYNSKKSV